MGHCDSRRPSLRLGGALARTGWCWPLRHPSHPTSVGLACRPVGALRRRLVKHLHSTRGGPGTFSSAAVSRTRAASHPERHAVFVGSGYRAGAPHPPSRLRKCPSQPGHHAGSIAHHTVLNCRSQGRGNSSYLLVLLSAALTRRRRWDVLGSAGKAGYRGAGCTLTDVRVTGLRVTLNSGDLLGAGGALGGNTTGAGFVDGAVTVSAGGGGAGLALAVVTGTWVVVGVVVLVDGSTVTPPHPDRIAQRRDRRRKCDPRWPDGS